MTDLALFGQRAPYKLSDFTRIELGVALNCQGVQPLIVAFFPGNALSLYLSGQVVRREPLRCEPPTAGGFRTEPQKCEIRALNS